MFFGLKTLNIILLTRYKKIWNNKERIIKNHLHELDAFLNLFIMNND